MIERDYLMRQIQQLVAAVVRAITAAFNLQAEGRSEEALEALSRIQRESFPGLDDGRRVEPDELRDACSPGGRFEPEIATALADILRMRCSLQLDIGRLEEAEIAGRAALDLYRAAASVPAGLLPADIHERIRRVQEMLGDEAQ